MTKTAASTILFAGLLFFTGCEPGAAAILGRSYFFASRDACAASGQFNPRECAAAFANARFQLRDEAPRFRSKDECRLRFRLCELVRSETSVDDAISYAPAEEASYAPVALGVEIVVSAKGAEAAPTLVVEGLRRIFRLIPLSRSFERSRREQEPRTESQNAAILPPDHFEPFSKREPISGATTFTNSALGAIEAPTRDEIKLETPEERRQRLKTAPLID